MLSKEKNYNLTLCLVSFPQVDAYELQKAEYINGKKRKFICSLSKQ
jgi:hypothetical protein